MTILKCNEMFQSGDGWEPCQMDAGHWPNLPHGKPLASTGDTPQPQDAQEALAKLDEAEQMLRALCHGERQWIMSIPARRNDPDLVFADAIETARKVIQKLPAATGKTPDALPDAETLTAWIEYWSTLDDSNVPDLWNECDTSIELGKFIAEKLAATLPAREAKEK